MIDRLFTAALAFTILIGATLAVTSAWLDSRASIRVMQLPAVTVVAKRAAPRIDVASRESARETLQ
jgi:hypothetical protein